MKGRIRVIRRPEKNDMYHPFYYYVLVGDIAVVTIFRGLHCPGVETTSMVL